MPVDINYICETPVVLIAFNRPIETEKTLLAIRKVQPKKLYFISDGARVNVDNEINVVNECRDLLRLVDWDCSIIRVFSEENLGCMRRIVTGLSEVFNAEEKAIIVEDDCLPSIEFFKFTEWGLSQFENDLDIGMISGSNLICHKFDVEFRNGFSNYINIWGWATWRRVWKIHNPYLSLKEINLNFKKNVSHLSFNWWELMYWKELFRLTVYAASTWDFQLQYTFFKQKMLSVYPKQNLVYNIGFSGNGTHTNFGVPDYVKQTEPDDNFKIKDFEIDFTKLVSVYRDKLIANEIWYLNLKTSIRLKVMNFIRINF